MRCKRNKGDLPVFARVNFDRKLRLEERSERYGAKINENKPSLHDSPNNSVTRSSSKTLRDNSQIFER